MDGVPNGRHPTNDPAPPPPSIGRQSRYTLPMSSEQKIFWIIVAVLVVVVAAVLFTPSLEEYAAPHPEAAWVAIQPQGADAATLGPVALPAGTPFTLHAVLEAKSRGGDTVYYTEAPALVRDGERVPAESVRRWERRGQVKVLWFTIEGSQPVLDLAPGETAAERFKPLAFLRDDWPFAWSVPGHLESANDDSFASPASNVERPFGTQRFQVRLEIVGQGDEGDELVPKTSFASWGADRLREDADRFPTVTESLPGPAGPASAVFGLTQVRLPKDEGPPDGVSAAELDALARGELRQELVELTRQRLAFATLPVLREVLDAAGADAGALPWRYVSVDGTARWGDAVHPGDLLRSGQRVVVLYADAAPGQAGETKPAPGDGVLDGDDLAFDFAFGAVVRPLSAVFEDGGGQVEWVPLGGGENGAGGSTAKSAAQTADANPKENPQ